MSIYNDVSTDWTPTLSHDQVAHATAVFRAHGGALRARQALALGVRRHALYGMVSSGALERLSRGLYRLAARSDDDPSVVPADPDLLAVAAGIPDGVICLISALSFHALTTQIPHEVSVAVAAHSRRPQLAYPPVRLFWFGGEAFRMGVETHTIAGGAVRIYSAEKTVADCFKFRNKVGLDVTLEALRLYRAQRHADVEELLRCARICRVERVMWPYLEALL